ncbi:unnamed protein product [Rotaria sordida]|uniref:LicD/FKTN/FKRP nucleotidyltransferase domain-containing protein n=1 Tax=Rotaria sordida TaxID=392033 RepID=A0A814GEQ8_9BILA|nr:unnamed protein product [Rotaria sordida]
MIRFSRFIRSNQYLFFIFIILFTVYPFLFIVYNQSFVSYKYIFSNTLNETRYERFCRQVYQRINTEQTSNIPIRLNSKDESIPYSYSQWRSSSLIPRALNPCEHALYMHLLSILIEKVFKKYNIQYMMMAGTLLGSYTRHDILPWDDDVDLSVSVADRYRLQSNIIRELSFEPYSIIIMQLPNKRNYDKVFFSWCPHAGTTPWRFPFIDIFYHDGNSTHVWLLGRPSSCPVRLEDVFPLVLRPLGSLWLYAPREPMAHFESRRMRYIETGCYVFRYSHKYEKLLADKIFSIECSKLKSVYPYVERQLRPISSQKLFSIQETLTILCNQFPLISTFNDSNFQCARLRIDESIPTTDFDLDGPTQIILFIIIDQSSSSNLSPINIIINFTQSSNSPSLISEIRLALLVTNINFTINNQTTTTYTPYDIPILLWDISTENTYDLVDVFHMETHLYETDASLCQWHMNRWNRLFNGNMSINVPYVYFLKTKNSQLIFTLIDTSNKSSLSLPPSPYFNILYCFPYKLEITEKILIICFGILFIIVLIALSILHYLKGGEKDRARHFERYCNLGSQNKFTEDQSEGIRQRPNIVVSSAEQDD